MPLKTIAARSLFEADSIALSLGVNTAASIAQRGLGLVRGVALAWLMTQGEFGLLGVALLVINLLLPACTAGLYEGIARYTPYHESAGTLRRFAVRSFLLIVGVTAAATIILHIVINPLSTLLFSAGETSGGVGSPADASQRLIDLTRLVLICILTLAPYHAVLALLKGLRMFRALSLMELVAIFLFTLLAVVGAMMGFNAARAVVFSYAVANMTAAVLFMPALLRHCVKAEAEGQPADSSRTVRATLLGYSVWAGGTAVWWHALSYYPMWHLLKVTDPETTGTFHAVRMVTQIVQMGAVMFVSIVSANATRLWEHSGRESATRQLATLTRGSLVVLLVGAASLSIACPLIMRIFPRAFQEGTGAFDPLLMSFLIAAFVLLMTIRFNLIEKPRLVFLAWSVGAAVNVAICCLILGVPGVPTGVGRVIAIEIAAWSGVAGVTAAAVVLVAFLVRERLAPDLRTLMLGLACVPVGLGWFSSLPALIATAVLIVLTVAAFTTSALFTGDERRTLFTRLGLRKAR